MWKTDKNDVENQLGKQIKIVRSGCEDNNEKYDKRCQLREPIANYLQEFGSWLRIDAWYTSAEWYH